MTHPRERNLLDYVSVVVAWRRLLVVGALVAALAGAAVSFVLPERWTARTVLLPPDEERGGLGMSLLAGGSGIPPGLAGLVGLPTPSERLLTLLDSRRLMGLVVDRFGLVEAFGAAHADHAIDLLGDSVERELGGDGSLAIEVTASTPQLAADLANAMAALLDSLNREYRQRQAQALRIFLDGRLASARGDLSGHAEKLRDFQKRYGIVDIEAQTAAAVDVAKGIALEQSLQQVELGVLSRQLSADHPDRKLLALRVEELDRQLKSVVEDLSRDLGDQASAVGPSRPLGPPLQVLPDLMHEYAALKLELEIQEEILAFLGSKLEEAKYREALDTPTLQVLDPATPPKTRSSPRRALLTAACGAAALMLLTLLAFSLEALQRHGARDPDRLEAIRAEMRR